MLTKLGLKSLLKKASNKSLRNAFTGDKADKAAKGIAEFSNDLFTAGAVGNWNLIPNGNFQVVNSDETFPLGWERARELGTHTVNPDRQGTLTFNTPEFETVDNISGANALTLEPTFPAASGSSANLQMATQSVFIPVVEGKKYKLEIRSKFSATASPAVLISFGIDGYTNTQVYNGDQQFSPVLQVGPVDTWQTDSLEIVPAPGTTYVRVWFGMNAVVSTWTGPAATFNIDSISLTTTTTTSLESVLPAQILVGPAGGGEPEAVTMSGDATISSAGVLMLASPPRVLAYVPANVGPLGSGWHTVPYSSVAAPGYDTGSDFNTTDFTWVCPEDGIYLITANVQISALATGSQLICGLWTFLGATPIQELARGTQYSSPSTGAAEGSVTTARLFLLGDVTGCRLHTNDTDGITVNTTGVSSALNRFEVVRLGDD